jgi:hypothetical protein
MKKNLYECECQGHLLEHEYDSEFKQHYITFWTHGTRGEKPSFMRRLKEALRVLRGKELQGFWGVVLDNEEAQRLSSDIENYDHESKKII